MYAFVYVQISSACNIVQFHFGLCRNEQWNSRIMLCDSVLVKLLVNILGYCRLPSIHVNIIEFHRDDRLLCQLCATYYFRSNSNTTPIWASDFQSHKLQVIAYHNSDTAHSHQIRNFEYVFSNRTVVSIFGHDNIRIFRLNIVNIPSEYPSE